MKNGLDFLEIKRVWQKAEQQLKQALSPYGIRVNDYYILFIAEKRESITISDLAEEGAMHVSTAWNFATHLEDKRYLTLEKYGSDKRITHVNITERGRKFLRLLNDSVANVKSDAQRLDEFFVDWMRNQ